MADRQIFLGLTGPAGVGKDTVASLLAGYGYTPYAFATPMKEMLHVAGLVEPSTREAKEANLPGLSYSYRHAAQQLGTEWARNLDTDFWVKVAARRVGGMARVVFSDVRFENEAAWIRSSGGKIVHIIGRQTTVQGAAALHASETGIRKVDSDLVLENDSTVETLHDRVFQILKRL